MEFPPELAGWRFATCSVLFCPACKSGKEWITEGRASVCPGIAEPYTVFCCTLYARPSMGLRVLSEPAGCVDLWSIALPEKDKFEHLPRWLIDSSQVCG